MVVLDTNVVSELMLESPRTEVLGWMDDQLSRELFVTAVTEAEVRTGIAILPEGARRRGLADVADKTLGNLFDGRVLPFDSNAARAWCTVSTCWAMPCATCSTRACAAAAAVSATAASRSASNPI